VPSSAGVVSHWAGPDSLFGMDTRDAVIVGARCAGSALAIALAQRDWDVLVVDRDTFPSETVSTHLIYPNTLARLEQLGVLDSLRAAHEVPLLESRIIGLGHEIVGRYSAIGGFDRAAAPRRGRWTRQCSTLAAGAQGRFGERVVDLIGMGTPEDPVAGVLLEGGERIAAKWVLGADGRASTVAGRLGLRKERGLSGEVSFLFGYWRGIPDDGYATLDIREDAILSRWAVEDGIHLLVVGGSADFTRGSKEQRRRGYLQALDGFAKTAGANLLERAEMTSQVIVAPESLMRGFFRTPTRPGWALVGDACHFKHPGTAQGIADAVEQAIYVAGALSDEDRCLEGYEEWREQRASEHMSGRSPGGDSPARRQSLCSGAG